MLRDKLDPVCATNHNGGQEHSMFEGWLCRHLGEPLTKDSKCGVSQRSESRSDRRYLLKRSFTPTPDPAEGRLASGEHLQ